MVLLGYFTSSTVVALGASCRKFKDIVHQEESWKLLLNAHFHINGTPYELVDAELAATTTSFNKYKLLYKSSKPEFQFEPHSGFRPAPGTTQQRPLRFVLIGGTSLLIMPFYNLFNSKNS